MNSLFFLFMMLYVYEWRVAMPWSRLVEKAGRENRTRKRQKLKQNKYQVLVPSHLSALLLSLATWATSFALLPNSVQFVLLSWAT